MSKNVRLSVDIAVLSPSNAEANLVLLPREGMSAEEIKGLAPASLPRCRNPSHERAVVHFQIGGSERLVRAGEEFVLSLDEAQLLVAMSPGGLFRIVGDAGEAGSANPILLGRISDLERELLGARAERDTAAREAETLATRIQVLDQQAASMRDELQASRARIAETEARAEKAESQAAAALAAAEDARSKSDVAALQREIEARDARIVELQKGATTGTAPAKEKK